MAAAATRNPKKSHEHSGRGSDSRYAMIQTLSETHTVKEVCAALGVARSSYYQAKKSRSSQRQQANAQLLASIRPIHREHRARFGCPRMTGELRRRAHACGRHQVERLMRQHSLRARRKCAFHPKTTQPGHAPCANVLQQMGAPSAPGRVWVSDITYAATKEGWLYLAVVLDLCSRMAGRCAIRWRPKW